MRVNSSDLVATRAFNVHEVTIRTLNESLELMLGLLDLGVRMYQIDIHRTAANNFLIPYPQASHRTLNSKMHEFHVKSFSKKFNLLVYRIYMMMILELEPVGGAIHCHTCMHFRG